MDDKYLDLPIRKPNRLNNFDLVAVGIISLKADLIGLIENINFLSRLHLHFNN